MVRWTLGFVLLLVSPSYVCAETGHRGRRDTSSAREQIVGRPSSLAEAFFEKRYDLHRRRDLWGIDGPRSRLPRESSLTEEHCGLTKGVIKDDFLVNDDTAGGCDQWYPSVAMGATRRFVVTWMDHRDGIQNIFAQGYDSSGNPQGPNFRVNDDAAYCAGWCPSAAMDETGGFVAAWEDTRDGDYDIYAQRFDSSATPQGQNFKVNDDVGLFGQGFPSVATDGAGGFVIAWGDARTIDWNIYAQRYDSSGAPLGTNFRVNDDAGLAYQSYPSVSMDARGGFVVAWGDERNGDTDIYAQRYDSSGAPQGPNFRVNDDVDSTSQWYPSVAMDRTGGFVIAWEDGRNIFSDIYAQRYDSAGAPQGVNFRVNDDVGSASQTSPSMAVDGTGGFVVTWVDGRNTDRDIYAQRYDASGVPQGPNFRVNEDAGPDYQWNPAVATNRTGWFTVVWEDRRDRQLDVCAQRYDSSGVPQGSNFMVNDDVGSAHQEYPSVAVDGTGGSVVTWEDGRTGDSDIYAQRYDSSGNPHGPNFRVNDDVDSASQWYPSVAMDAPGGFVIGWADWRNAQWDIYVQRYDSSGSPQGSNFRVNDDVDSAWQWHPSVAMDRTGGSVVTWEDDRKGHDDIYVQRYDSSGNPQGSNFRVNDDMDSASQWYPSVAMDRTGGFAVAWEDYRNGWDGDIYVQRYDLSGNPQGSNFMVNDDMGSAHQECPSVAMDESGAFVVAWFDTRNGAWDIYAQRYDSAGNPQEENFMVNDQAGSVGWWPSISVDPAGGRFVIFWTDRRNADGDPEVMAQKYVDGTPSGANLQINQPDSFPYNHQASCKFGVASNSDVVVFTWHDNRRHKGWDIYAKLTDWDLVGVDEEEATHEQFPMINFRLMQNYPNPLRRITDVRYEIPAPGVESLAPIHVSLRIYDMTGRAVRTLVNKNQQPGWYSVSWDGKDGSGNEVASGVYFYRLQAGDFTATKKMIVLR